MSTRAQAIDVDGDEFMAPAASGAAAAAAVPDSVKSVRGTAPASGSGSEVFKLKFTRPATAATVDSDLFAFGTGKDGERKNFTKQYAALYFTRLSALKPLVLAAARAALPSYAARLGGVTPVECARILDMEAGQWSVIAGTLYKEMKLKPCILEEYAKTSSGAGGAGSSTRAGDKYTSPDDSLVLEDQFGRVALVGNVASADSLPVGQLVSGLVVAALGREIPGGKFEVMGLFTPGMAPQKPLSLLAGAGGAPGEARAPAYMLCVSGLLLGTPGLDPTPLQLLMDYVSGLLGSRKEQASSASIVRVLVAGDSLHRFPKATSGTFGREENDGEESVAPLRELDLLLTQLVSAIPVDLIPGDSDPSNFTLPQQPLHKCLFPSASTYSTLHRTTNPAWISVHGGIEVLATAGQNVADLGKYCEAPQGSDFLESTLRWRCIAPTAPDTLGCYPFQGTDPFVLQSSPHLYIAGNQSSFSSRLVRGAEGQQVRTVTLPVFATTGQVVLVDMNSPTLEAKSMSFKVQK